MLREVTWTCCDGCSPQVMDNGQALTVAVGGPHRHPLYMQRIKIFECKVSLANLLGGFLIVDCVQPSAGNCPLQTQSVFHWLQGRHKGLQV